MSSNLREPQLKQIGMGIDPHAVLFRHDDGILRAIRPAYEQFYAGLLDQEFITALMEEGLLVKTKKTGPLDGYNLVLEHPLIPFVTYPFEWSASMFKSAALAILELNLRLMRHGYCTQDAHPWNILFDGINPKFVDFTSIIKLEEGKGWIALDEFDRYCLNPLILMSKGFHYVARTQLREILVAPDKQLPQVIPFNPFSRPSCPAVLRDVMKAVEVNCFFAAKAFRKISSAFQAEQKQDEAAVLARIQQIKNLDVSPVSSAWSNYYSGENELPVYKGGGEALAAIVNSTPKHALIHRLLGEIKPSTMLDIGCNRGLYSQMAALQGTKVVGVDMDELALDEMYRDSCALGTHVLPLYLNAVAPAEAIGFKEIPFPSVTERLKSDCVLCLAVVHHLVFKRTQMPFSHIAKWLASFSKKHLIVEFVPREDKYVKEWYSERYSWYTCENFIKELKKYFSSIEVFDSFPEPRLLLSCKKEEL